VALRIVVLLIFCCFFNNLSIAPVTCGLVLDVV
jgi:hypothetical protein